MKYLGIHIDRKLTLKKHIGEIVRKVKAKADGRKAAGSRTNYGININIWRTVKIQQTRK